MKTIKSNEVQPKILQAVTTFKGVTIGHEAKQRFYLMFGVHESSKSNVTFHKICSFTLFDSDSIQLESCNDKAHLLEHDLEVIKYAIGIVSYRLIEMVCSKQGEKIWGLDLPSPTELVESYLIKKPLFFLQSLKIQVICILMKHRIGQNS